MKSIITSLPKSFPFNLSGTRKLVIDPRIPTEVSDEEYDVLKKRLGNQIKDYVKNAPQVPSSTATGTTAEIKSSNSAVNKDEDEDL